MTKTVEAIVRGPLPYFGTDGVLYMPGQEVIGIPAEEVSEDETREVTAEEQLPNGNLRERKVAKPFVFRPVNAKASAIAGPVDTAEVATGNPDRLNVTDFLKQGADQIVEAIASGSVDDHLGAIEQASIAARGSPKKGVREAIAARLAATRR